MILYYLYAIMKRVYAIILLIPVLILFMGSVTLASSCAKMAAGRCGETIKSPDRCMMAMSHQGCGGKVGECGQKCHGKKTGKSEQKGKDGSSCCLDCPLCCLVTFKPVFRWDISRQVTVIDYIVMSDNNLSDYFQQHWKPPNGSFLS
jgi:hypothetical protein